MRRSGVRILVVLACALAMALAPAAALADGWALERGLIGGPTTAEWASPDVSGNWVVFLVRGAFPDPYGLGRIDLRTGSNLIVATDLVDGLESCAVDGDWAVYTAGGDIHAKNLATGVLKHVTNDGGATDDSEPAISGKYVVWEVDNGLDTDIWGRDISTMHAKFLIAGGDGSQLRPSIYGKRVAYRSELTGFDGQIMVKTIGSSTPAVNVSGGSGDHYAPSIGSHLVAWLTENGSGMSKIRYYNYDTGETLDGPSATTYDMLEPQVCGDRILFRMANPGGTAMYVFDIRARRSVPGSAFSFSMPDTASNEVAGKIAGDCFVYLNGGLPTWGKLLVPSMTIGSVPKRVAHHGHIHLKGKVSDQGVAIGYAPLRVEKYSGGKWVLVKTLEATASGNYSYTTPTLHAKTKFRVAYDGSLLWFSPGFTQHLSAVSAVRTGWPL
jgi:hypothetical protein